MTELFYHVGGEPGPARWARIREALTATLAARGVDVPGSHFTGGANAETIDFLRWHDLGFRIRRLRLLARRLSELEAEHGAEADFEPVRDAIYNALGRYLEAKRSDPYADLRHQVRTIHGDAGPALDALAAAMDLTGLDAATDAALADALRRPARRTCAARCCSPISASPSTTSPPCRCCRAKGSTNSTRSRSTASPPTTRPRSAPAGRRRR